MKWHIVCRIGEEDKFSPDELTTEDHTLVLHFSGGAPNEQVRENVLADIEEKFEAKLSAPAVDFLYAAMAAYITDLYIPRRTAPDRWSRELELHLPVHYPTRWRIGKRELTSALNFLTGDSWKITTRTRHSSPPEGTYAPDSKSVDTTCLLSGGLDSLAGAIQLLGNGERVAFVSHHGGGLTPKFQNDVLRGLMRCYPNQCNKNQFYVVGPKLGGDGENTMRSRSILFMGLGVAVASIQGVGTSLHVPENGLISLNVPLTGSRVGSSSTRTTHPHYVGGIRKVLAALKIPVNIVMPYRHLTKGEMLKQVKDSDSLKNLLGMTMSCSHPEVSRWSGGTPGIHCGYCFPCLIRRAAVHAAKLESSDASYSVDVRKVSPGGSRESDLRALKIAILRDRENQTDGLARVLLSGPIPADEIADFGEVYERGMCEMDSFLDTKG